MNRHKIIRAFDIFSAGLSYFKNGYGGYLTFIVGLGGAVSSVYYLTIQQTPWLKALFPTFASFIIPALGIGIPLAVGIGIFEQKSSLVRGQNRINPFQRTTFEMYRRIAEKEGWAEMVEQIDFLMGNKKKEVTIG